MNEPTRIQLGQNFVPAGTRLSGIYEIDEPLAKGGMGEVYRGHTIETGDPVAIKLIRSDMADNEAVLAMFRREASALSRLHHEAIIRYFVFSLDPGLQRHFLAMELVNGEMLSTIAARGPIDVDAAVRLMSRLASGLQAAHERGIIHRDLSPDNVIIEDGQLERARIIDFGIARSTRIGDATVIGSGFAGKYNYVSPEQLGLFGGEVTGRSDIYSLGLVIVQCLLGRALDMGGSQVDVIEKRRRVPDLTGVDARIRPLLERMLQPDPNDRPATMAEITVWRPQAARPGKAEKAAERARTAAATRSRPQASWSPWKAVAGVTLVGVLAAGGIIGYLQFSDDFAPVQQVAIPTIDRPNLTPGPALQPPAAPETPSVPQPQPTLQPSRPPETAPAPVPQPTPPVQQAQPLPPGPGPSIAMNPAPPVVAPPPAAPVAVPQPTPRPAPPAPTPPPQPVALPVPKPTPPPAPSPVDKLDQFIRDFDGGDCFLAMPTALTATSADIDAFGMSRQVFEALDDAFTKTQGFEASIDAGQVTQGQCAALRFVTALRRSGKAKAGRLEIARTAVRSGEVQTGSVVTEQAATVLLVVDDEGRISDVSQQLAAASSGKRFNVRLTASRPGRAQPVILLALTSARPLATLRDGAALTPTSLSAVVQEASGQGGDLAVAAKYFKIE